MTMKNTTDTNTQSASRSMSARGSIARRELLRGAGVASIALPLWLANFRSARGATPPPAPERLVSVYFGNGLPADLTSAGLTGTLAPLAPYGSRTTMVRGINAVSVAPGTGHIPGSASFCCAMDSDGNNKGGPSLDWVAYQHFAPPTPIPVLAAGVFGETAAKPERVRWIHTWRGAGQPVDPYFDTLSMFNLMFGSAGMPSANAGADEAKYRYQISVLDAVVDSYKRVADPSSRYPAAARTTVSNHLELVREMEKRTMDLHQSRAQATAACKPGTPAALSAHTSFNIANATKVWALMSDLYVTGLRCDLFRFGSVVAAMMGGEAFPAMFGSVSTSNVHGDWYHNYASHRAGVAYVINWALQSVAVFLSKLDDSRFPDLDGRTLLDNTTVVLGTELSDPASHSRQGMTFFLVGGKMRFKPGMQDVGSRSDTDLYNTILRVMGVPIMFGKPGTFVGTLPITL